MAISDMAKKKTSFGIKDVDHVSILAGLKLTKEQKQRYTPDLSKVIGFVSKIQELDTKNTPETSQVTGLTNVYRNDVVEKERMFTQKQALSNAKNTHKGYFLVPAIFEE